MAKDRADRSTSIEEVLADYRKDPEYQKAERLISPYYELATQIIKRRVELGLTQKDLAEKAKTYQSRISKIESGEHDIRFSTLISVAEALQCEVAKNILVPLNVAEYEDKPEYYFFFKTEIQPNQTHIEYTRVEDYQRA
jgi:transcriptional regulator with XRE-family HTH domain